MNVEVRLFATLRRYLPPGSGRTAARLGLSDGASIADVLDELAIPPKAVHLVLINGLYEANRSRQLTDGCVVSIWPPVAGG